MDSPRKKYTVWGNTNFDHLKQTVRREGVANSSRSDKKVQCVTKRATSVNLHRFLEICVSECDDKKERLVHD